MSDSSIPQASRLTAEGEPFPILVVRTTETDEQLDKEASDLARRGITRIVFYSQAKMDQWLKRVAALDAQQKLVDAALLMMKSGGCNNSQVEQPLVATMAMGLEVSHGYADPTNH